MITFYFPSQRPYRGIILLTWKVLSCAIYLNNLQPAYHRQKRIINMHFLKSDPKELSGSVYGSVAVTDATTKGALLLHSFISTAPRLHFVAPFPEAGRTALAAVCARFAVPAELPAGGAAGARRTPRSASPLTPSAPPVLRSQVGAAG